MGSLLCASRDSDDMLVVFMCVCVCVCERERECVCVYAIERARKRKTERESERERITCVRMGEIILGGNRISLVPMQIDGIVSHRELPPPTNPRKKRIFN